MSTAVETALDGLEAVLSDDAVDPEHVICVICYPDPIAPAGAVVLCGVRVDAEEPVTRRPSGRHTCASCLQVESQRIFPCGHR